MASCSPRFLNATASPSGATDAGSFPIIGSGEAGRALAALERELGVRLLNRTTRRMGWGQFFDYHVQHELRASRLVQVLSDYKAAPTLAHIVHPQARLLSPNVRAFVDFAAPALRERLATRN